MTWIDFVNLLINGLIEGLVVALPALAMTLVMGVNRFPNAATGDMLTTGAYAAVAVQMLGAGRCGRRRSSAWWSRLWCRRAPTR